MKLGGCVYLLTNKTKTVIYCGVTSDLISRVSQHKNHEFRDSFTAKYKVTNLVYYEQFISIEEAIAREKQIKAGSRKKKEDLINSMNHEWRDLYPDLLETL